MKLNYFTIFLFMISILKITAQSGYSLELNVKTIPTKELTKNETGIGFSFYKNVDSKNKITNSVSYKSIGYNLNNYYSADNSNSYNNVENNLELTHQMNSKIDLDFKFKTVAAFENNLSFSNVRLLGGAGIKYSLNENNTIHLGAERMTVFGKAEVLPSIAFYSKLNANNTIEIGFPNSSIHYSNNERNVFSLTNTFDGEYYKLNQAKTISTNLSASTMRFSQMTTALEYERNIDSNWFMSFKGGYDFNKKYALTDDRGTTKFNFNANDGYLFNIGIKYKQ